MIGLLWVGLTIGIVIFIAATVARIVVSGLRASAEAFNLILNG